jgi:hypothetical protein
MRVFAGALVMSSKSKRKHKLFDIEAKDRNETKTLWCVPEPEVERFYLFQKFWNKTKTFWFVSHFFLATAKRFYLFQKLRNKTKTFWFSSQISKTKTERFEVSKKILKLKKLNAFGSKILESERERFGSIINFVSKTNMFDFFGDVSGKTKANDLEITLVWHYYCGQHRCSKRKLKVPEGNLFRVSLKWGFPTPNNMRRVFFFKTALYSK